MRIGVDAGPMLGEGGISRYVGPLIRHLIHLDTGSYRLVVRRGWLGRGLEKDLRKLAPLAGVRVPDRLLLAWWDCLSLPLPGKAWSGLDVFIATCMVAPVLRRGRVVSIVYDLTPLRLPDLFPRHPQFRRRMTHLVRRSTALIAISENTRRDLIDLLGADPVRTHVIQPGVDACFRPVPQKELREVVARHGIQGKYVLYAGSMGPHKNVETLLRAFGRARRDHALDAELVLAGGLRWASETLRQLASSPEAHRVHVIGHVPDEDLAALYSGAELFVFPSLYEGFGLPVIEAMACGTPVIVSKGGALPEVGDSAALTFEAEDDAALASSMARVARDGALRRRMSEEGRARAREFSWTRSAEKLRDVIHDLADTEGSRG